MQNKKGFSKKNFSVLMAGAFILSSCTTPNTVDNDAKSENSSLVTNFRDWSSDRILNTESFETKGSLKVNPGVNTDLIDNIKLMNALKGKVSSAAASAIVTGTDTLFTTELRPGDRIYLLSTRETYEIASIESNTSLTLTSPVTTAAADSDFEIVGRKNTRAKSFGAVSLYPAIDLNGAGTADDILYFTSDNSSGSNFFALNSNGNTLWERTFDGKFIGNSPKFSGRTIAGKKIMYLASASGHIYCIDTDGRMISSVKVNDSFENMSVWVDSSAVTHDYIYAASQNGNFYRFKLDLSNSQIQSLSTEYTVRIASTSFSSSPVLNNTSVFVGGENGVFYEVVPNTGQVARSWNLGVYHNNGAAAIRGIPAFAGNIAIVPAGGYLFRIENSTVSQSPLLELKEGVNSRTQPYGTVFKNSSFPTGAITSSPVFNPGTNNVYISNGNTAFEVDYSSINSFQTSARYCTAMSARLDASNSGLVQNANGTVAISRVNGIGASKLVMVDVNYATGSTPYLNYFSVPFAAGSDVLERYMAFNEFDSKGYPVSGANTRVVPDGNGNVYFTMDNGTVNLFEIP